MGALWEPSRAVLGFWVMAAGDGAVMEIEGRPGNLISLAAPSGPLATHPFLHGVSRDPKHEHALREILLKSSSFHDFCERVVAAGYDLLNSTTELFEIEGAARRIQLNDVRVGALFEGIGAPSTLTSQPSDDAPTLGPAVITAYDTAHAAALLHAGAAGGSFAAVLDRLQQAGFSISPVS